MPTAAHRIQASLLKKVASASGVGPVAASVVAASVVAVWRDLDAALSPIIGHRGVAALLGRSLHLTRGLYPWLESVQVTVVGAIDFEALHTVLSQQEVANVIAVNGALLERFVDLLTHLIGVSLTDRLIDPILDTHSTGDAA